jgi:hypothetical protein
MRIVLAIAAIAVGATQALAANSFVVSNENVKKECGACHMAFQPAFLPARSWEALMGDLPNHFGEDASLKDPALVKEITDYLVQNAGDAGGKSNNWVKRIAKTETPLRISETPGWVRAHSEEVGAAAWKKAGSKANCVACHKGADVGNYGEEGEGGD